MFYIYYKMCLDNRIRIELNILFLLIELFWFVLIFLKVRYVEEIGVIVIGLMVISYFIFKIVGV